MRGEDGNLLVLDIASVLCGPNKCFISIAFKSKHKHCRLPGLLCFQTFSSNFLKTQKTKSTVLLGRYRTFHEQLTSSIFVCLSGSRYIHHLGEVQQPHMNSLANFSQVRCTGRVSLLV